MSTRPVDTVDNDWYEHLGDQWWNTSCRTLAALRAVNQARTAYFRRVLSPLKGLEILDLGCGGGFVAEALARCGARVTGVDQWITSIEAARKHALENGLWIDYLVGHAAELPCRSSSFDAVICADFFEHVSDHLDQVLQEVARVLRNGGKICYDTPNRTLRSRIGLIWLMQDLLRLVPRRTHDWSRFIRPSELADALERHGMRVVETQGLALKSNGLVSLAQLILEGKPGSFEISDDLRLCYIGYAVKN